MKLQLAAAFLIGAFALTQATAQAQDEDLPVAGPDETIFVGEVPAPPGTDVWAFYLISDFFFCGHTTTDDDSRFVLVVDAKCATPLGPAICWGELPDWKQGPEEFCDSTLSPVWGGDPPGAGETVEMGILVRTLVPGTPTEAVDFDGVVVPPRGDGGADIALPHVGMRQKSNEDREQWLLALGAVMLMAGLSMGGFALFSKRL